MGYAKASTEQGDDDATSSGFDIEGAGALRVPFGSGGLLEVAAVLEYQSLSLEANDTAVGDLSSLNFGADIGFFVFF